MFIQSSKSYLILLQSTFFSNQYVLAIFSLIELLPILYNVLYSGFTLSKQNPPPLLTDSLIYLSYFDLFHNKYNGDYPIYYFIISIILILVFAIYKYVFVRFYMSQNNLFNIITLNIFEIVIFRLLSIVIFDVIVSKISDNNLLLSIASMLFFILFSFGFFYHFYLNFLYLNVEEVKPFLFNNKLGLNFDYFLQLLKIAICLCKNYSHDDKLSIFLNLTIFCSSVYFSIYQTYKILTDTYFFFSENSYDTREKFSLCLSSALIDLYLISHSHRNDILLIFMVVAIIILSGFFTWYLKCESEKRLFNSDKELIAQICFILNEKEKFFKSNTTGKELLNNIIITHCSYCPEAKCLLRKNINDIISKDDDISIEKVCFVLYKSLIKDKKSICAKNSLNSINLNYVEYNYILELYFCYVTKKEDLIRFLLKYHKIKKMIHIQNTGSQSLISKAINFFFTKNFSINVEILYHKILERVNLGDVKIQNIQHLLIVDSMTTKLKEFFKHLHTFLHLTAKPPQEFILLSRKFKDLKKCINVQALTNKEFKYYYPFLLCGFILEEIFNDEIIHTMNYENIIGVIDDLLESHYRDDRFILALYSISLKEIIIKQSGKDLNKFLGLPLEKIFPNFLMDLGKIKLLEVINQKKNDCLNFYFYNEERQSVERLSMKCTGIPSLNANNDLIYVMCQYIVEKENLVFFEKKEIKGETSLILRAMSFRAMKILGITMQDITKAEENGNPLVDTDFIQRPEMNLNYNVLYRALKKKCKSRKGQSNIKRNYCFVYEEELGRFEVYRIVDNTTDSEGNGKKDATFIVTKIEYDTKMEDNRGDCKTGYYTNNTGSSVIDYRSSMTFTNFITSRNYKKKVKESAQQFHFFTYFLLFFGIFVLFFILIFLIIELMKNVTIETTFGLVKIYNDFQSYFIHSCLSVFSLTCNSDFLTQVVCVNQFTIFCAEFVEQYGLTKEEMMNDYLGHELNCKTDLVMSAMKLWNQKKQFITSSALTKLTESNFSFTIMEEVNWEITTKEVILSLQEAIKRTVNIIYVIPTYPQYLTSVIWTITADGYGYVDTTNIKLDKEPLYEDFWLLEVQKLYYNMILNFQKFINCFLGIGDIVYQHFEDTINETSKELLIFLLILITLHLTMVGIIIIFLYKFKALHLQYFISLSAKTIDLQFMNFYTRKMFLLEKLTNLYRENPNEIIKEISDNKSREELRVKQLRRELHLHHHSKQHEGEKHKKFDHIKNSKFNYDAINKIYNHLLINTFVVTIFFLFFFYISGCVIFYIIIITNIHNLSLMNKYTKYTYDVSNNLYLNLCLLQIMSLTNQTDPYMVTYFYGDKGTEEQIAHGYVRDKLEYTFTLLTEIERMENKYSFLLSLPSVLDLNCSTFHKELDDPIINSLLQAYPESDTYKLLEKYCIAFSNLNMYHNDKMAIEFASYRTGKILDMFVDTTYDTYAIITNCELLYRIYTDILMIIRPLRDYIYNFVLDNVRKLIMNRYILLIIVFLIFNVLYEGLILYVLKFKIVDNVVGASKDLLLVTKSFECHLE